MDGSDSPRGDEDRRARREARARRTRRRRVAGAAGAVLLVAGTAAIVVTAGGEGPDSPPPGRTGTTTVPGVTAGTTAPVTAPGAPEPRRPDGPPADAEQVAAVEAVRRVGVPLYRTPGKAGRVVALTFDDGPGPYTHATVATLRRHGMRATFFLNGTSVLRYPDEPAREATVAAMGDHTWSHAELPALSAAGVRDEIASAQRIIRRTSGTPVRLFRPPYGARDAQIDRVAGDLGMIMVLWSIDSGDSAGAGWQTMLAEIRSRMAPGDIILFHENRGQTQKVVNRLIPWMQKHGWRSVSIPELLVMDPPSPRFLRQQAGARG